MKTSSVMLIGAVLVLTLSGCADTVQLSEEAAKEIASHGTVGFWYGLWHGFILPFSWLLSLFFDDIAIYAVNNNGGWYDFGFFLGVVSQTKSFWTKMYYYNNAYTDEIFSSTGLCLDRMQMASQVYRTVGEKVVVVKDRLNGCDRGKFLSDADCKRFVFEFVMNAEHVDVKIPVLVQANTFRNV